MQDTDFMLVEDHFARLTEDLSAQDKALYNSCRNVRVETAFKGRHFIVYQMSGQRPVELDRIIVTDFRADPVNGISAKLRSSQGSMNVSYAPVRVFNYPVFVWLPLHSKLRWGATADDVYDGSLGFPICLRTKSRLAVNLREPGITYMETGPSFGREFDSNPKG